MVQRVGLRGQGGAVGGEGERKRGLESRRLKRGRRRILVRICCVFSF